MLTHSDIALKVARVMDKDLPDDVYQLITAMNRKVDAAYLIVNSMADSDSFRIMGEQLRNELDKA